MKKIVICDSKGWFREHTKSPDFLELDITYIINPNELTYAKLREIEPDFVFFPHWSWKVPDLVTAKFNCIVFHTAPLPFGRGGSPIQNLIKIGFEESPVNALKMVSEIDAGPIYTSRAMSLLGSLDDILGRLALLTQEMIVEICATNPSPRPQSGDPVLFTRLNAEDNNLRNINGPLSSLYDAIRMVDSKLYTPAYIELGDFRFEFRNAILSEEKLVANVEIRRIKD